MTQKLGSALGLPPSPRSQSMLKSLQANVPTDDVEIMAPAEPEQRVITVEKENDFKKARKDIDHIISTGMEAMENLASVAQASENPRAYEVLATTMKVLLDASKDRVKLHNEKEQPVIIPGQTTNNTFVGTTNDILRLMREEKTNGG